MPIFSSKRERRLWAVTLLVLVAIYSTLELTGKMAGALREEGLLAAAFMLGMLLVVATVVALRFRTWPGWAELGVWLGIAAAYMMVFVRMSIPEERTHLIEYGVVAVFIHEALRERAGQGRRVPVPAVLAVGATALLGLLDECIQALLPTRHFDLRDIGFNALAGLMAVGSSAALGWVQRWKKRT